MFHHVTKKPVLPEIEATTTPEGRVYLTPDGNHYPSVTTVLGKLKQGDIDAWREKVGAEQADKISAQASTRGTEVHSLAENYINNDEQWSKGFQPANVFTFSTIKGIVDDRINNIYWQEAPLYSDQLKTAGRVDLVAEFDGVLSIIDFKTSRKPKRREWIHDYFNQCAFYSAALYERTGLTAKQIVVIVAVDNSEPQVFVENAFDWLPKFAETRKKYEVISG